MNTQALDRDAYLAWEARLGFDRHGGAQLAAAALGVSTEKIRRLRRGDGDYSHTLALAMSAVAMNLPPWQGSTNKSV